MLHACELPIEVSKKHFKELYRVLVPGGRALVLNLSNATFQVTYLTDGANKTAVQEIDQTLTSTPNHPSQQQINEAFKDLNEVISACFTYDKNGSLFHVKDVNQLVNGQAVVHKTAITTFPDFYYHDQFLIDQTTGAGLQIDQIENIITEERRIMHNTMNPETAYSKMMVDHPFCFLYHLSKPT